MVNISFDELLPSLARRHKPRYSSRAFYVTLLLFCALGLASWSFGRLTFDGGIALSGNVHGRSIEPRGRLRERDDAPECRLVRDAKDQCAFVRNNCPDHEEGLFSYLQLYYCTLAGAKPVAFLILVLWLSLLFSTIGIAASDFLCVDLSTLASILGMSESLTGVTFLAFGNGSPDVFSTFAAVRSNSGSLAVGELLGAASFITSVVAGSMALVRPFRVARRSFVRDVGFFAVAISFSMVLLADGRLYPWECIAMIGLYAFYVVLVVTWHWFLVTRRRKYERTVAARSHFHVPESQELEIEEAADDDDPGVAQETTNLLHGASTDDFADLERSDASSWREDEREHEHEDDDETENRYLAGLRDNMRVARPSTSRRATITPIRPSLVGALEFQSVLSSLQKSRSSRHTQFINLSRRHDDLSAASSQIADNRSVRSVSHRASQSMDDHLGPINADGPTRARSATVNGATSNLNVDSTVSNQPAPGPVRVTVREPDEGDAERSDRAAPEPARLEPIARSPVSPTSSGRPSRSTSPAGTRSSHSPDLLVPPSDGFRYPTYRSHEDHHQRSPLPVSPRGTTVAPVSPEVVPDSPTVPFPPYRDDVESTSSRTPSIHLPPAESPTEWLHLQDRDVDDHQPREALSWWPCRRLPEPHVLLSTLFPTLAGWRTKSARERLLGLVAAPSVLLLTITVPIVEPTPASQPVQPVSVVVTAADEFDAPAPLVRLPEDSPVLQAQEHDAVSTSGSARLHNPNPRGRESAKGRPRWDSEMPAVQPMADVASPTSSKEWNRWLVLTQMFTGPFFVALIGWTSMDEELSARNFLFPFLCSLLFSSICFTGLCLSTRRRTSRPVPMQATRAPSHPPGLWRPFLALIGFVVAITWIATIATEVVAVLKTVGVILNISDSLLGLTVFAVGNSLGDLVADITVARLGYPVMALSACFGGPMLNILLGIGVGGLYMTLNRTSSSVLLSSGRNKAHPYEITISKVLIISGATLLVTLVGLLVVVPLNNWRMDRRIGWGLIVLWTVSTLGNVIAEVVLVP